MSFYANIVIPAGKRVSSAKDGNLSAIPVVWIPAIHAGMTNLCIRVWLTGDEHD